MNFPFFISKQIIFKQPEQKISSERYLINQIESNLEQLEMTITKIDENELFLRKIVFVKTFRKKIFIRNLRVVVKTDNSNIQVTLITETILTFFYGFFPIVFLFERNQNFPIYLIIFAAIFLWSFGYITKYLVLREIKNELEKHLISENNL